MLAGAARLGRFAIQMGHERAYTVHHVTRRPPAVHWVIAEHVKQHHRFESPAPFHNLALAASSTRDSPNIFACRSVVNCCVHFVVAPLGKLISPYFTYSPGVAHKNGD
jgi:hypothetical protein